MKLLGAGNQSGFHNMYDASGTITSGGTAQLVLPIALSRSSLVFVNDSDTNMYLEIGGARATASLSSGAVSSCSVTNVGFGYSRPPSVVFLGGTLSNRASSPTYTGQGLPCWPSPSNPAQARCVMTGSAPNQTVSSITIDNPGSGYAYPPIVMLINDPLDLYGAAVPSAGVGILLLANGGNYTANGSICTTDQISVFCATISKAFTCKYTV